MCPIGSSDEFEHYFDRLIIHHYIEKNGNSINVPTGSFSDFDEFENHFDLLFVII